jgi:hypothetical protein
MNLSHVQVNLTLKVNQAIVLDLEKYDFDLYKRIFNGKSGLNFARFRVKIYKKNKIPDFSVSSQKYTMTPPPAPLFFRKTFLSSMEQNLAKKKFSWLWPLCLHHKIGETWALT